MLKLSFSFSSYRTTSDFHTPSYTTCMIIFSLLYLCFSLFLYVSLSLYLSAAIPNLGALCFQYEVYGPDLPSFCLLLVVAFFSPLSTHPTARDRGSHTLSLVPLEISFIKGSVFLFTVAYCLLKGVFSGFPYTFVRSQPYYVKWIRMFVVIYCIVYIQTANYLFELMGNRIVCIYLMDYKRRGYRRYFNYLNSEC